ncbi:hypothetical protein D3C81_585830 [compost metagenome]
MALRFSVNWVDASSSRPRTCSSPTWRVILPSVTLTFCCLRSYTAAVSKVSLPIGWYFTPTSYWRPSVGSNDCVELTLAPLAGWNDSVYEK